MQIEKHQTFYHDEFGRKHFCTWLQHGKDAFDIRDVVVHEDRERHIKGICIHTDNPCSLRKALEQLKDELVSREVKKVEKLEYQKTNWVDEEVKVVTKGTPINAENLNKLESIIESLVDRVNELTDKLAD